MKKRIPVRIIKEEKEIDDLEDLIKQFDDDYPEEMSMLDQALQDNDPESAKAALSPELMALINREEPGASDDVKDMLAALDKSDADRAAKAKQKAAKEAAVKKIIENPQPPMEIDTSINRGQGNTPGIQRSMSRWNPFPGLLDFDATPEAKQIQSETENWSPTIQRTRRPVNRLEIHVVFARIRASQ